MKTFLHIGCGAKRKDRTTPVFAGDDWQEVRFDIDESARPDIIGSMTDLSAIADDSFDAVYSSHNIEHLYPHEVPVALREFARVLKSDGFLIITCPDLQSVCAQVAEDRLTEAIYDSPAGPIAPIDILYGHRASMMRGNLFMAHRCGFTEQVLIATLRANGFASVASRRRTHPHYDLWAAATRSSMMEDPLRQLALDHFPR